VSPRRRLLVIGTALAAVLALTVIVAVRLAGDRARSGPPDQATPGTVLLVPGYGGGTTGLGVLADFLESAGRTAVIVTPPGDGTGDLRAQADALEKAVQRALDGGAPSVDIVGYSAGGVVTRLWFDRHDGTSAARRVVTLGSPLHGAKIAATGVALAPDACPTACQQLAPGSDLLARLDRKPAPVPWLSVWTENDQTVQPPDSARLDGATNLSIQSLCPGVTVAHAQLPTDPLVSALVLRAIGTGPIHVPASCAALQSGT
jgi:triacylglycerol esterase/lipase EstA (alpha/beta hydrolase family)